ncbi:MAG: exo-alpha-sialidase [Planctomycetes bacterium]|nr:exo-alpha-sialidase [Planctomycetota bacterium]
MIRISKICKVLLILFIQIGILFLHAPCAWSDSSNQAQKLIVGFEQAELSRGAHISREEKPGRESWFYLLEQPEGFDFAARFEWPGETNRAWTWHCRPGAHTEGELALVATVGPVNSEKQTATYRRTEFLSCFYPNIRRGFIKARLLMTSFQWLVKARPDLRDWSDYGLLCVDVHPQGAPVKLWLALEDNVLEPPVMRTYEIPANKWVTLELDLKEAQRVRELDLAKITNFWLMARSSVRATVRIDNIRIAKHGTPVPKELLQDNSPMAVAIVMPKKPELPNIPSTVKPNWAAASLTKPIVVARGSIVPFGWVSAYDNRFIFVAYSARDKTDPEAKDEAKAVFTEDGGLSWKQLADPTARNLDHGTARGCAIDVTGDGIAVSSGPGCAGLGNPNPRQHLTKYSFTGKGWEARFPTILDSDIRHCGSNASVVRLSSGPFKGRLWASWGEIGREHAIGVHAKYSDDDGRTWIPWGKGAALPGSQSANWSDGTYGYPETVVTPYKEHVACFWRHKRKCGVKWSVYDGSDWSAPADVSPITLDDMDGAYRATMSAITKGDREIFFTATGLDTVLRWDGKSWRAEPVCIEDGGMLSIAGDFVVLFTSGKVNRRWKGIRWQRRAILRCLQRLPSGRWEGPVDITPEFTIDEYRSLAGFSVPPYAPMNFIPLAWSDYDEGTIKFLRIPVPLTVRKDK